MLARRAQITECLLREGFGLVVSGRPGQLGSILLPTKSRVPQSVQFSSATHPSFRYLFPKSAHLRAHRVLLYFRHERHRLQKTVSTRRVEIESHLAALLEQSGSGATVRQLS